MLRRDKDHQGEREESTRNVEDSCGGETESIKLNAKQTQVVADWQ